MCSTGVSGGIRILILAAWLPVASMVMALCLYDLTTPEQAVERPSGVNPNLEESGIFPRAAAQLRRAPAAAPS